MLFSYDSFLLQHELHAMWVFNQVDLDNIHTKYVVPNALMKS